MKWKMGGNMANYMANSMVITRISLSMNATRDGHVHQHCTVVLVNVYGAVCETKNA